MSLLLKILVWGMKCLYGILKLFPVNEKKILFLSRQTNGPSLDFTLIQEELQREDSEVKMVSICKRAEGSAADKLEFAWGLVRSLYHMATARVCVLDTYWPPVSLLKHKKDLTVIQIWHALGKLKQSGYQALDKEGGRSRKIAGLLKMHENYDVIIAGGKAWNPYYCEAFHVKEEILVNIGLPRIDHLLGEETQMKEYVWKNYPQLKKKPVVLYAPTFRRSDGPGWEELIKEFDFEQFHLVVKPHPNQELKYEEQRIFSCDSCKTIEVLAACDILITDYSSISLEAAILNKKTYYYLYDYEDYMKNNGMNIDICKEMNSCVFKEAGELVTAMRDEPYHWEVLENFKKKYLPEELGTSTKKIVQIIRSKQEVGYD